MFLFLVVLSSVLASATLVYPKHVIMNYGTYLEDNNYFLGEYDLGDVAPGQVIELVFSRNTGPNNTESSASIFWESAEVKPFPYSFKLNPKNLTVRVSVPETLRGDQKFNVTLYGHVGTIAPHLITFKVKVKEDVFSFEAPSSLEVVQGHTEYFFIKVKSSSAASDTLIIRKLSGIPSKWIDGREVFLGPFEEKTLKFSLTPNEEGYYPGGIVVERKSSALRDFLKLDLRVKPSFDSKLKAFSEGYSVIPVVLQPFYSLMSLLGLL